MKNSAWLIKVYIVLILMSRSILGQSVSIPVEIKGTIVRIEPTGIQMPIDPHWASIPLRALIKTPSSQIVGIEISSHLTQGYDLGSVLDTVSVYKFIAEPKDVYPELYPPDFPPYCDNDKDSLSFTESLTCLYPKDIVGISKRLKAHIWFIVTSFQKI